jgi:hypothetical protein
MMAGGPHLTMKGMQMAVPTADATTATTAEIQAALAVLSCETLAMPAQQQQQEDSVRCSADLRVQHGQAQLPASCPAARRGMIGGCPPFMQTKKELTHTATKMRRGSTCAGGRRRGGGGGEGGGSSSQACSE